MPISKPLSEPSLLNEQKRVAGIFLIKMARIPETHSLLTHNNLIPQASNRKGLYQKDSVIT